MAEEGKCQHRCECDHKRVKFCKKCQVVHCLDCQQEWTAKSSFYWYPYSWPNTTWPKPYEITWTTGATSIIGNMPPIDSTPTITCDHGVTNG